MRSLTFLILCFFTYNSFSQVSVVQMSNSWELRVDGEPYKIKGVTFGYDDDSENYDQYFADLNFLGVNTIRTWGTGKNTPKLLDAANAHGIKVMLGIWMRHGRPGMEDDDQFNYLEDAEGMKIMFDDAITTVKKYKDHPAILTWGIGNEVYLNTATDEEKKAYSILLEKICSSIKSIDKMHPITSVEAWTFGLDWWEKYVPSLDIYGLNSYGRGVDYLNQELNKRNINKPYVITEFGVMGEWDIKEEKNGIKVEPSDKDKYNTIVEGYRDWILPKPACLGVFVFHYSNGNEFIAPWLFSHFEKGLRPTYWAIREAYTDQKPTNSIPVVQNFEIERDTSISKKWIPVSLNVYDIEAEPLEVEFRYNQRSGSRKRRDQILKLESRGNLEKGFEIQIPEEDGPIKVYCIVKDSYQNIGVASSGIIAVDKIAAKVKHKVPRANLPFHVYKDGINLPYFPSAYMGNYKDLEVDLHNTEEAYKGSSTIKIKYNSRKDWYGIGFVDPANDWGDILGGYNIDGAKKLTFWAKTNDSKLRVTVGYGLIDKDKPFPDSSKKSKEIELTNKWKKYTIKIKKNDMHCVRSGFVLFSGANGFGHEIFIDEIVYE